MSKRNRGRHAVEKQRRASGVASSTSLADRAQQMTSGQLGTTAAAAGPRPDPGPLPPNASPSDIRHAPIRWAFPWATNQVWTPRRNAYTPFATLRHIADVSDLTRICIETRKDQMTSLGWDIAPRKTKSTAGMPSEQIERQVEEARAFFRKPDRRRPFSTWLRMALEDVLVIDALSIYRRPTRGRAAGLPGYKTAALEIKDGATFLPLLDEGGDIPLPPAIAYRQIIQGVPMQGGDCSIEQLYYRPRTERSHTPYGLSPTEAVLLTVNAALNRQMFNLAYYTEGNVPEGLIETPEKYTKQQLLDLQEYFDDYLTGDLGRRRRLKIVPSGGSKVYQFKEPDFTGVYDEWLLKVHCAAFAVPPQEIGFTGDVNKATGQMQENVSYRRGVKPMGQFFKDLFDEVIAEDLGTPHLQWVWTGGEQEDKKLQAEVDQIYVDMGKTSVDELRIRDGQDPIGLGPYVQTAMGPVFVEELLTQEPDDDPDTSEAGTPRKKPAASADDTKGEEVSEAAQSEIRIWRANAIKAVKSKKPVRDFVSAEIPFELHARIERFLKRAEPGDVGAVVAAFELAIAEHEAVAKTGESRRMTRLETQTAKAYKRLVARHFKKQGAALVEHLKKGLTE